MFLALVRVLVECLLQLGVENLHKVCTFVSLFFQIGLTCAPILLDRSTVLVKMMAVTCVVAFVRPTMLLAKHTVFLGLAHLLGFLLNVGVHQLHLALSISPFHFKCTGLFCIMFGVVLDVLEDQQEGSCTDGGGILCQIVLHLPLGWTPAQQVSCKVGNIQGRNLLGSLICLWAVVQAR